MKILVPIKRVPDWQIKLKLLPDGSNIQTEGIKWIINTFDEIAVEEAIRLKEKGQVTEIVLVSIGPADVRNRLEYALAMGADSAILVKHDGPVDSDLASRAIAEVFKRGEYQMILLGKQAIDSDSNQTAQLLAGRLQLPQACFASKVLIDNGSATVTREIDGGLETIKVPLPCVVSTDLRLNEPRYAALPNLMKAKKKPFEETSLEALGVSPEVKVRVKSLALPAGRKAGKKVADVTELISALQNEAKVL
ncbi:MAG: electron transfer flavoprotein subunit beta/FixA family protein [Pseudomonadota bacterium]|jgi:electron transfer flavoprotein beta subunit